MNDEQLQRYCRHILLPQIDIAGQQRLIQSTVLIVGLGGLGSPAAMYLAASGVGRLILCDDDHVEPTNLQRQIIHTSADLGRAKVDSARDTLLGLNPDARIETVTTRFAGAALDEVVDEVDAVVDASDNFATRFALNEACHRQHTPLISGAAIRMQGQVSVFQLDQPDSPCYHCLFADDEGIAETCSEQGILAPVCGIIGAVQATETLKTLIGLPNLAGRLLLLDAYTMSWRSISLTKDPHCPVCSTAAEHMNAARA